MCSAYKIVFTFIVKKISFFVCDYLSNSKKCSTFASDLKKQLLPLILNQPIMKTNFDTMIEQAQEAILRLFVEKRSYSAPHHSPYLSAHCGTFARMHG